MKGNKRPWIMILFPVVIAAFLVLRGTGGWDFLKDEDSESLPPAGNPAGSRASIAPFDFATLDRKILREPAYLANPLYGLIVFDPEGKSKAWFVLDKSSLERKEHDVLFFDRNGNGDLTEAGERIQTPLNEGGTIVHEAGSIQPSGSGEEHTELRIYASMAQRGVAPFFRLKLHGLEEMWGGFRLPRETTSLGATAGTAPVFVATLALPLTFRLFLPTKEIPRGDPIRVAVIAGVAGHGPGSFMGVHENYLVPGKDRLFGTWVAKDGKGREVRERFEITGHC